MFVIRKEQMNVFSQYMLNRFFDNMQRHLNKRYPEQTKKLGNNQLRELIVAGTEKAKEYDITDENDVKRFLEYLVEYGQNFGKSPETIWASQFLHDKELSGTMKMNEIDNYKLFVITLGKEYE